MISMSRFFGRTAQDTAELVARVGEMAHPLEGPHGAEARSYNPPYDDHRQDRQLLHRLMRLAYEDGADWLVESLERDREHIATQAAFARALEREAGARPME